MKLKLLAGVAMATAFAASAASAQVGWYGAVDLGWHWPEEMTVKSAAPVAGAPLDWNISGKDDWAGFARLGYQLNDNWRVEFELGYRGGDIAAVRANSSTAAIQALCTPGVTRTAAAPTCGAPDGDMTAWTFMGNVLFDIAPNARVNPFVGVGVGMNRVKTEMLGQFSTVPGTISATNAAIQNLTVDDKDTAFAWQGIAGLAWRATDRLNVDLTYRYLGGSDLEFGSSGSSAISPDRKSVV